MGVLQTGQSKGARIEDLLQITGSRKDHVELAEAREGGRKKFRWTFQASTDVPGRMSVRWTETFSHLVSVRRKRGKEQRHQRVD